MSKTLLQSFIRLISRFALFAITLTTFRAAAEINKAGSTTLSPAVDKSGIEFFESKIRPVLIDKCYSCHSAESKKLKGDLYVDSAAGLQRGGESGKPSVVPGHPETSKLIEAIEYKNEDLQMPPKEKLSEEVVANFKAWIKMGAPDPRTGSKVALAPNSLDIAAAKRDWWSFKPPQMHDQPKVKHNDWVKSPIDAFILASLEQKQLQPAPPADRRDLLRRATMDLTGLPPTAAEVDAFAADKTSNAFEKVLDRLLASPAYGERWGRHWLDICRYADSKGYVFEEDRRYPFAYTFRDWVVKSFNDDLPYDQFITLQLAADRLQKGDDKSSLAAMGFLTVGRRFLNNQADVIDDRLDVISRGLMGLTVSCARCHDHKFDPIPIKDYYSLYGVLASSNEPKDLPQIGSSNSGDTSAYNLEKSKLEKELEDFRIRKISEINTELRSAKKISSSLLAIHSIRDKNNDERMNSVAKQFDVRSKSLGRWSSYLKSHNSDKDPVFAAWNQLGKLPEAQIAEKLADIAKTCSNEIVAAALAASKAKTHAELAAAYGDIISRYAKAEQSKNAAEDEIRRITFADGSPTNFSLAEAESVFNRDDGNKEREFRKKIDGLTVTHPGSPPRAMVMLDLPQPVQPRVFKRGNPGTPGEAVPRQFLAIVSSDNRQPFKEGSGRLEMAQQIASKDNPLTARVMVNRIWAYHFGHGIVRTPSDFGRRGELPTHPELLDYMAVRFMNEGWSVKKMHKLMMLSSTYQQSCNSSSPADLADPENRFLSHTNRQRLDFESLRDSLLAVSGQLDSTIGGRPVEITQPTVQRRTIYGYIDRQNLPNVFRAFDFASPDSHSPMRYHTTVPQQALFMMNSPFLVQCSKALLQRKEIAGETDSSARITKMYQAVLSRKPTAEELQLATEFVGAAPIKTDSAAPKVAAPAEAKPAGTAGRPKPKVIPVVASTPINAWEQLGQVLLESNEFSFMD